MSDAHGPTAPDLTDAFELCGHDAAAFEALVEAEFHLDRVPRDMRPRAESIARVLGILEHHPDEAAANWDGAGQGAIGTAGDFVSSTLIDATLARVARTPRGVEAAPALGHDDEDALEALVNAKFMPQRVASGVRERAGHIARLVGLLDAPPAHVAGERASSASDLVARTLARVQDEERASRERLKFAPVEAPVEAGGRRFRLQLADLVAAASVALIGGAVLVPMLGAVRETNRRMACQANMMSAGLGFGQYAMDFRGSLPLATASPAGSPWWDVGTPERSNSANLFTLARTNYTPLSSLACGGNPGACASPEAAATMDWRSQEQVSYSYQNMFAAERPRWVQNARVVVLVDRSPIIPLARLGQPIDPMANSLNHMGRGQNVLFNDQSAQFIRSPVLENYDNVYLPRAVERFIAERRQARRADPLRGTESPASADDVFVGP